MRCEVDVRELGTRSPIEGAHHVEIIRYEGTKRYRKAFEEATLAVIEPNGFFPEQVGPYSIAASYTIPMTFCLTTRNVSGDTGCDEAFDVESNPGTSLPTVATGATITEGSVARLITDVRGSEI